MSLSRSITKSLARSITNVLVGRDNLIPTIPSFILQPQNYSVSEGGSAIFTCAAIGYPSPNYHWMVNINDGFGFVADLDFDTSSTLILTNVTSSMNGYRYRCTATNSEGIVNSATAILTVTTASPVSGSGRSYFGWFFGGFGGGV